MDRNGDQEEHLLICRQIEAGIAACGQSGKLQYPGLQQWRNRLTMYQKFSFGKVAALPELKRLQAEVEKSARHSMVWSSTSSPTSTHVADGCSIKLRSEINGDSSSVLKVSPEYMSLNQDTRHLLSDHIVHPVWMPFAETLVRYSISPHGFFVESLFTTFGIKNFDDALACFHAAMYFKLDERFFCYFYRILHGRKSSLTLACPMLGGARLLFGKSHVGEQSLYGLDALSMLRWITVLSIYDELDVLMQVLGDAHSKGTFRPLTHVVINQQGDHVYRDRETVCLDTGAISVVGSVSVKTTQYAVKSLKEALKENIDTLFDSFKAYTSEELEYPGLDVIEGQAKAFDAQLDKIKPEQWSAIHARGTRSFADVPKGLPPVSMHRLSTTAGSNRSAPGSVIGDGAIDANLSSGKPGAEFGTCTEILCAGPVADTDFVDASSVADGPENATVSASDVFGTEPAPGTFQALSLAFFAQSSFPHVNVMRADLFHDLTTLAEIGSAEDASEVEVSEVEGEDDCEVLLVDGGVDSTNDNTDGITVDGANDGANDNTIEALAVESRANAEVPAMAQVDTSKIERAARNTTRTAESTLLGKRNRVHGSFEKCFLSLSQRTRSATRARSRLRQEYVKSKLAAQDSHSSRTMPRRFWSWLYCAHNTGSRGTVHLYWTTHSPSTYEDVLLNTVPQMFGDNRMHLLKSFLVFLRSVEDSQYQAAVSSESAEGEKMLQSRKVGKHCWRDLFTFFTVFKDMPSLKALHEDEFSELNLNTTLDAFHVYCLSAQVGITLSSSNADVRLNDPPRSRAAKRQRSL